MKEEWKQIHKGRVKTSVDYFVSNLGRIKSIDRAGNARIVKPWMMGKYLGVSFGRYLNEEGKIKRKIAHVHTIVLKAFTEQPLGCIVHHKDNDKYNNKLSNLEWITSKRNTQESITVSQLMAENAQLKAEIDRLTLILSH